MKLSGNTILITGGTRGIGLALTEKLAELGNTVIAAGRSEGNIQHLISKHDNIFFHKCDLTNPDELETLLVTLENKFAELNVIINNAAIQLNYYFTKENPLKTGISNEIETNFTVPVKLTASLIPLLSNKPEAAIVNISSGLAFAPKENASVYCATKAAIHSFTTSLRYQLENTNIKVFELIPPLVNTSMTEGRGNDKIEPKDVANKFADAFEKDEYEINIGKIKMLRFINRLSSKLTQKILRNSQ